MTSKFSPGNLVTTLEAKVFLINPIQDPPVSRSPKPRLANSAARSTGSSTSPMSHVAFPRTGTSVRKKKTKPYTKSPSYDIHLIGFTPDTPLVDLSIPDNCSAQTLEYVNQVTIYLNSLSDTNNPHKKPHDITRPCVVCKQIGHDFNGCPILKDHEFLRDAVIKSSLYFSNEEKRQRAALKKAAIASIERKRFSMLNTISTINDMDSDDESVIRYLDDLGVDDDDADNNQDFP